MQSFTRHLLASVTPADFGYGAKVRFVCTENVPAPAGFEQSWFVFEAGSDIQEQHWLTQAELLNTSVAIVITDLLSQSQRAAVQALCTAFHDETLDAPPLVLLPAMLPGDAERKAEVFKEARELVTQAIDAVIWGASDGFTLVLALHAQMLGLANKIRELHDELDIRAVNQDRRDQIQASLDSTRWHYLRSRLLRSIPPMQANLGDEGGRSVAGFQLGRRLTQGLFGAVHVASRPQNNGVANGEFSLMLVMEKSRMSSLSDLRMVNRFIQTMETLNNHRHPNLCNLLGTFHSQTRLYVHMDVCGTSTLFGRLKLRDTPKEGVASARLPTKVLQSMVVQICNAVSHLHLVPQICHRDIKPENLVLREREGEAIDIKLACFELAATQRGNQRCKSPCGTVPFVAPEVILAGCNGYSGMAADMWSLGILCMEISRGVGSVCPSFRSNVAPGQANDKSLQPSAALAGKLQETFSQKNFLSEFFAAAVAEVHDLQCWMLPLVSGLVEVSVDKRCSADQLAGFLPEAVGEALVN